MERLFVLGGAMGKKAESIHDEVQMQIEAEQLREKRWLEVEKRRHKCYKCVWSSWPDERSPKCMFGRCVKGTM